MVSLIKIKDSIENGESLKQVAEIYTELAAHKLGVIRERIEKNRQFASELAVVFHHVSEASGGKKSLALEKKRGSASLLISSNHPLYGSLENRLIAFFMAHSVLDYGDVIVVGRTGRDYLSVLGFKQSFETVLLAEDLPNTFELTALAQRLAQYERVLVYHSKLSSVIVQRSVITEIGAQAGVSRPSERSGISDVLSKGEMGGGQMYYIFEPEVGKMLEFFDTQIVRVLLTQAFLESELARTGARLLVMDESQRKADLYIASQEALLDQAEKAINNAKILEMTLAILSRKRVGGSNGKI